MNGLERYAILSKVLQFVYQITDCRKQESSGPQTSVERVEGEVGGPMIRRHGTCMLTCTCH